MLRIKQLKDTNAFFLLIESSKNESISSDSVELLSDHLIELFLLEVTFLFNKATNIKIPH